MELKPENAVVRRRVITRVKEALKKRSILVLVLCMLVLLGTSIYKFVVPWLKYKPDHITEYVQDAHSLRENGALLVQGKRAGTVKKMSIEDRNGATRVRIDVDLDDDPALNARIKRGSSTIWIDRLAVNHFEVRGAG
jgi:ABC-type transporter Mla subunit MlaD